MRHLSYFVCQWIKGRCLSSVRAFLSWGQASHPSDSQNLKTHSPRKPCPTLRPDARQIVGQETLSELQRRLAPCGFYAHPNRPQDMFGYLGLGSVANQVWDHTVMERVAMRVEFTPIGMALDDVDANLMRTRKARSPCLPDLAPRAPHPIPLLASLA